MTADNTAEIQRGRPFEKGVSGNPTGRPRGSRNATTLALEALLGWAGECTDPEGNRLGAGRRHGGASPLKDAMFAKGDRGDLRGMVRRRTPPTRRAGTAMN